MNNNFIDTELFKPTEVIKSLKTKHVESNELNNATTNSAPPEQPATPRKSTRGRKPKYHSDEERIMARRAQQKAYRERRNQELNELRALRTQMDTSSNH